MRYDNGPITLLLGDCRELLPTFPDGSFDCLLSDPPYSLDIAGGNKGCFERSYRKIKSPEIAALVKGFDIPAALAEWDRLLRQKSIFCFCSNRQIAELMTAAQAQGFTPTVLVWHKYNSVPFANGTWRQDAEFIIHARKKHAPMNGRSVAKSKVKRYPLVSGKAKYGHPTAKPIGLLEDLLLVGSNAGDTILDPYCGSGTAAIACLKHGRRFVGIERERAYFDQAIRRVEDYHAAQLH